MKKTVLIYGLIAGAIVLPMLVLLVTVGKNSDNMASGAIVGYTSMLLAFSMIFFGVRSYKKNQLGGSISFWRALSTGCLIALLSSTIYVITWVILSKTFYPDFADHYMNAQIEAWKSSGMSADELAKKIEAQKGQMDFYKTWPGLILFTYSEILIVGLPIALISAIILSIKKKKSITNQVNA